MGKKLQEGVMWGNSTHFRSAGHPAAPPSTASSDDGVAFASGLFLGDCPVKCQLIASSAMTVNKYILPKKKSTLHQICCALLVLNSSYPGPSGIESQFIKHPGVAHFISVKSSLLLFNIKYLKYLIYDRLYFQNNTV